MRIGVFAKTFARRSVGETFAAVREHGLDCVQFNFNVAGLATLPARIEPHLAEEVRREATDRGIHLAAVSATFNMIDPDLGRRSDGLRRLRVLAEAAAGLDIPVLTLCTGTRDPHDMWRRHPGNAEPGAWRELVAAMREAVAIARDTGVMLAFEPELANVVDTAAKARLLLDEIESPHLRVVFDAANLVRRAEVARTQEILEEALELIGDDIAIAHAKDIARDAAGGSTAAGQGLLDFAAYVRLLARASFPGPLILHSLAEAEVAGSAALLRAHVAASLDAGEPAA